MRTVTLGSTGIVTPQNAFGALPIQRISEQEAVRLLHKAYEQAGLECPTYIKPECGHHPHGLDDPTEVVAFILAH